MANIAVNGKAPAAAGAAFVAENATLAGDVRLEAGASVWYGAVLRADTGRIVVGAGSNVQDNAVLHTGPGLDVVLGRGVSVGHGAILHGCTVGDGCMVGMHATVLDGAVLWSLLRPGDERGQVVVWKAGSFTLTVAVGVLVLHVIADLVTAQPLSINPLIYLELMAAVYLVSLLRERKRHGG